MPASAASSSPTAVQERQRVRQSYPNFKVVVLNDDVNTFEHVISTLIRVCRHTPEQAEQCTWIIHYKGKCAVKQGSFEELKPMKEAICEVGIDARII